MDMTISIPDDVAAKLKDRAARQGEAVSLYAAQLLAETVNRPTIDELLAPVRADFEKTGMTENQLLDFGREVLGAVRKDKAKSA
jgi:hypothetical protein